MYRVSVQNKILCFALLSLSSPVLLTSTAFAASLRGTELEADNTHFINGQTAGSSGPVLSGSSLIVTPSGGGVTGGNISSTSIQVTPGVSVTGTPVPISTAPPVIPTTPVVTPSTSPGGIVVSQFLPKSPVYVKPILNLTSPVTSVRVIQLASKQGFDISWHNPSLPEFTIEVYRSKITYPRNARDDSDTQKVYAGNANYFTDVNILIDTPYYYTVFVKARDGSYSTGTLAYGKYELLQQNQSEDTGNAKPTPKKINTQHLTDDRERRNQLSNETTSTESEVGSHEMSDSPSAPDVPDFPVSQSLLDQDQPDAVFDKSKVAAYSILVPLSEHTSVTKFDFINTHFPWVGYWLQLFGCCKILALNDHDKISGDNALSVLGNRGDGGVDWQLVSGDRNQLVVSQNDVPKNTDTIVVTIQGNSYFFKKNDDQSNWVVEFPLTAGTNQETANIKVITTSLKQFDYQFRVKIVAPGKIELPTDEQQVNVRVSLFTTYTSTSTELFKPTSLTESTWLVNPQITQPRGSHAGEFYMFAPEGNYTLVFEAPMYEKKVIFVSHHPGGLFTQRVELTKLSSRYWKVPLMCIGLLVALISSIALLRVRARRRQAGWQNRSF